MQVTEYRTFSISMPIVTGETDPNGNFIAFGEILGTCFSIGGQYLLTADHVIKNISKEGAIGIIDRDTRQIHAASIIETESLSCDIAIIKIKLENEGLSKFINTLQWSTESLSVFSEVSAIGYPHGKMQTENGLMIVPRGFKGYVISNPGHFVPLGYQGKPFSIYEINFQAPAGLSGSPLLLASRNIFYVVGLIIGNSSSKILVFENEEIIRKKKGKDDCTAIRIDDIWYCRKSIRDI